MQPSNALQQMLRAPHRVPDVDNGTYIRIDRDRAYCSISNTSAGSETRILNAPQQPGLQLHLGCILCASGSVVVTIQQVVIGTGAVSTTGTVTFSAAGQWVGLTSVETTAGVYAWNITDNYGVATTVPMSGNVSSAMANCTVTNIQVSTAMSVASILGTNISCASMSVSSAFNAKSILATNASIGTGLTAASILAPIISATSKVEANSILATNISAGVGLTAASILAPIISATSKVEANSILATNISVGAQTVTGNRVLGAGTIQVSGGTAAVDTQATALLTPTLALISVGTATNNYFKLPAAAKGIVCNVINLGSTAGLVGATAGVSIASATSVGLATANAIGSGLNLVCDGTNWWHRAI